MCRLLPVPRSIPSRLAPIPAQFRIIPTFRKAPAVAPRAGHTQKTNEGPMKKSLNAITLPLLALMALLVLPKASLAVTINPTTRNFAKEGGGAAVIVTAGAAESWTATDDSSWINITPTTSGIGNGTVAYLVSANLSADNRVGRVTIGGQVHTVNQSGYTAVINPQSSTLNLAGGFGAITVLVDAGIAWTATSDSIWCKITSGSSGFGGGTVLFTVDPNTGVAARYANITVAGQVFAVAQSGTDVVVTPSMATVGPETSLVQFNINALAGTSWTIVPQVDWLYPIGISSGSGAAGCTLVVVPNSSWMQRVGTVLVGSALLTVAQAGVAQPVYSITPPSVTAPSAGAAGAISVSATMDAPWNVSSLVPWVTVVSGASGSGNGGVQYVVSQNPTTSSRSGSVVLTGTGPQAAPDLIRAQLSHGAYINQSPRLAPNASSTRPNNPDGQETYFNNTLTSPVDYTGMWARTQNSSTYAFWFRTDYANRINRLFSLENGGAWANVYAEVGGRLRADGPNGSLYPPQVVEGNVWYHLILRQTPTNVDMWLNGQKIASSGWSNQLQVANTRVRFGGGGTNWGTGNFFQGSTDDYRCWDRNLSDQEIGLLYTCETAGTSTQPYNTNVATPTLSRTDGQVACYLFEQNTVDADQFGRSWNPVNMDGWTTDRFGRPNSAVNCTNGSGYVVVPGEDKFHARNAASHIFWVKFNNLQAQTVFAKECKLGNTATVSCYGSLFNAGRDWGTTYQTFYTKTSFLLSVDNASNLTMHQGAANVTVGKTGFYAGDSRYPYCDPVVPSAQIYFIAYNVEKQMQHGYWYQFCITATNDLVSLYINGDLYSTVKFPDLAWGVAANSTAVPFGAAYLGGSSAVPGFSGSSAVPGANAAFDDYQIYDRVLSASEVLAKYNSESRAVLTHTITQAPAVGQLGSTSTNLPASGGGGSVGLSIGSAAVWTATSDSGWLTFVGTNGGFGSATINYAAAANNSISNRIGTLTIAGVPYTVAQAGRSVTVTGGPFGFGPDGGLGSFNIASENNAAWAVGNSNSWISLASGGSGTTPASCMFIVSPYASPLVQRTGFLQVGTNTIAVTQSGYTASVSPLVNIAAANGGSQSVTVSVPAGAIWSTISQVPWITIIGGQSQSGSGNLTYIISGNPGGTRSGTIIVAGQVVTVTQNSANPGSVVQLGVGSRSARPGQQVVVPITGVNFSNIQTAQFSVKWDYMNLQFVGAEQFSLPGVTPANFGYPSAGTMSFSWEHPSLDSTSLASGAPLLWLRFNVIGSAGTSTQVRLESQPTLVELTDINANPTVVVSTNGWVTILNTFDISGNVKYQGTQFYVSNVNFAASGDLVSTINSGVSNSYVFSVTNGASITISASKSTDTSPSAGVSTADIVQIRRHVLGISSFTDPYKLLAGDANGSGTVTTADISALRKLILGITNALPAGMWQMVASDYIFQNPLLPWNPPGYRQYYSIGGSYSGQHFVAIKVGDVDLSWTNTPGASPGPLSGSPHPTGLDPYPLLTVSSATTGLGGTVALNVLVTNFVGVTGIQFSMDWDPALLAYNGITVGGLPLFGSGNIGTSYTNAGRLGIAWDDVYGTGVTLPDGTNLFQVNFSARGVAGASRVNISDIPTMEEVVVGTTAKAITSASGRVVIGTLVLPPVIESQSISNNTFTIVFGFQPGVAFGFDYSTNLTTWSPVTNPQITIKGSKAQWSDDGSQTGGMGPRRFYRVTAR